MGFLGTVRANRRGGVVIGLGFAVVALIFSVRASVGLMTPLWEVDPGWSRPLAASGAAILLAVMALAAPGGGYLLDRLGPRPVFALGVAAAALAVFATGFVSSDWQFLTVFGMLGGVGAGIASMPAVAATVARYFICHRGLASGLALTGASGGQLLVMPLLGFLVGITSWRIVYLGLGLALLTLVPLSLVLLRRPPPADASVQDAVGPAARAPLGVRLRFLGQSPTFLLLLGAFSLCGFTTAGVIETHLLPYAAACGYPILESATAYGVLGAFNGLGLLVFGYLADRYNPVSLLAGMFFARAATFVLLLYIASDVSLLFLFAALFGMINFATLPVVTTIVAGRLGIGVIGLAMGILFGGHSAGAAAGAFMGGWLYGLSARYEGVWNISLGLALLAGALTLMILISRPEQRAPAAMAA